MKSRRRNSARLPTRSERSSKPMISSSSTPRGPNSYLMRLAHSMADTLITPLNDSFVDFDVLGMVDPTTFELTGMSHYAEMVREARRQRRLVDGGLTDWVIVRNRLSTLGSRNKRLVGAGVEALSQAARFSRHRRICRARGLSRIFPARTDGAGRDRKRPRSARARAPRTLPHATRSRS